MEVHSYAESAIHRRDEAGHWPATNNSNRTRTQGVALGWYEAAFGLKDSLPLAVRSQIVANFAALGEAAFRLNSNG
jgi:hypothetical protein